ncbi:MAG: FeoB-associated Cys-rich membrane protein [Clostridia bacterium]|nr:FeoB-associated Cys-rich membrane protein [Clostridia bacterium]
MTLLEILVIVGCCLIVGGVVTLSIINKKKGKTSCGCGCDCSKCSACCNKKVRDEKQN